MTEAFNKLHIFGAGGSGREIAWLSSVVFGNSVELIFVVDQDRPPSGVVNAIEVRHMDEIEAADDARFVVALGNPTQRERITRRFLEAGHVPATIIHPGVQISPWAKVGLGSVVCANSVVSCNVTLGHHVHVNLSCTISHDVEVGDYSTLSPAVNVAGNVRIGNGVFVGTNACFINGHSGRPLVVGDGAVIAAGACVTQDVPAGAMVAGVPAVRKR